MRVKRFFLTAFLFVSAVCVVFPQQRMGDETVLAKSDIPVAAVTWNPDGKTFATAWNNAVILWDAKSNEIRSVFSEHTGPIKAVHFSRDGAWLLTLGQDNMIVLRDLSFTTGEMRVLGSGFAPMHDALIADNGDSIILPRDGVTTSLYYRLRLTNRFTSHQLLESACPVTAMDISKDGSTLLVTTQDGTVTCINVKTGAVIATYTRYAASNIAPRFSPDGKSFIAAQDSTSLVITAIGGGDTLTIRESGQPINCVVFSNDGTQVALALKNGIAKIVNVFSGRTQKQFMLSVKPDEVTSLSFSADNASLLVGTQAGYIMRWNISEEAPAPVVRHEPATAAQQAPFFSRERETVFTLENMEQGGVQTETGAQGNSASQNGNVPVVHPDAGMEAFKRGERVTQPAVASEAPDGLDNGLAPSSVTVSGAVQSLSDAYYDVAFGLSGAWRTYRLYPLYAGGGVSLLASPPDGRYPYSYTFNGKTLNKPWLYKTDVFACFGLCNYRPERELFVFAESRAGIGAKLLFNNEFTYSRTSKISGDVFIDILMGVQWKRLHVACGGGYDASLGLAAKAEIGCVLPLKAQ